MFMDGGFGEGESQHACAKKGGGVFLIGKDDDGCTRIEAVNAAWTAGAVKWNGLGGSGLAAKARRSLVVLLVLAILLFTFIVDHKTNGLFKKQRRRPQIQVGVAARHGYTPVTPLEDPTNSFVEIVSALIHDCIVGIERGGTAFSNRGTLVSLSIQGADLQEQRCLSRLAELRDQIFDGREVLDQVRHALRQVSEEWSRELARRGHVRRRDFYLRFNEFAWEVRQRLDDPMTLRRHQDRIRAFLGVRTRVSVPNGARIGDKREAVVLYDMLQGLDALLHGRHNHGNILPRLISLDEDNSHSEELIMARDVICGILPGPSILTFETAVRKFFVPLLATRAMGKFFRERQELGQLCEQVAFGEREAMDALDEARRILRRIVQEAEPTPSPQPQIPTRRRHDPAPYKTRHHIHHLHWCHDSTTCRFYRRRETVRAEPRHLQPPAAPPVPQYYRPFFYPCQPRHPYSVTPFYTPPMPSPVIPPDLPPLTSHTHNGRFVHWA